MPTEQPTVPRIECSNCGTEHHIDAAGSHCRECFSFLRKATEAEKRQMVDFLEAQMENQE